MKYVVVILFAGAAFAQRYEIGANVGYGFYRSGSIYSASGTAQAQQIVILDGSVECVDGLPAQHGAGAFDGHTGHHRNGYSKVAPQLFHRHQPRLEAAGIEAGFDEQKVGASLEEAFGLQVVIGAKPGEGGGAGDIEILVGGPHGTSHEARLGGGGILVRNLARQFGGGE